MNFDFSGDYWDDNLSAKSCWLAGTNHRVFKANTDRRNILEIHVSAVCENVWNATLSICNQTQQQRPLKLALNFLSGSARIYQRQVEILLSDVSVLLKNIETCPILRCDLKQQKRKRNSRKLESSSAKSTDEEDPRFKFNLAELDTSFTFTEEEKTWLAGDIKPDDTKTDLNLPKKEQFDYKKIISTSYDLFSCEGCGDMGIITDEEMHILCNVEAADINSKYNFKVEFKDESADENDTFEYSTVIFKQPNEENIAGGNSLEFDAGPSNQDTSCCQGDDNEKSFSRSISNQYDVYDPSNFDSSEENFAQNIKIMSTPLPRYRQKRFSSSSNTASTDSFPPLSPVNDPVVFSKIRKSGRKLKIDKVLIISKQKLIEQFDFKSTLRQTNAKDDIMPYEEMKKVNSVKLLSQPAHRLIPKQLSKYFERNLLSRKTGKDRKILNSITTIGRDVAPLAIEHPYCEALDSNIASREKSGSTRFSKPKCYDKFKLSTNIQKQDTFQNFNAAYQMMPPPQLTPSSQAQIPQMNLELPVLDKSMVLRILQKLWKQEIYPINIETICGEDANRKNAAIIFAALLVLAARRKIRLQVNEGSCKIFHIGKIAM